MSQSIYREMEAFIDSKLEFAANMRRDLHHHAEAGWHEVRTCSIIYDQLVKYGYTNIVAGKAAFKADARMGLPDQEELDAIYTRALEQGAIAEYAPMFKDGFTGIIAILETGKPGPVIGFRQDIDALGVYECQDPKVHRPAREGFSSVNPGEMHACGHDAHATNGMLLAETLMKYKDALCGTIKIVFQPAEEGVRGARGIVESGILDDVDYMIGLHMGNNKEAADTQIYFRHALCMANCKMDVYLTGSACHAASPENGNNAMLAAATIIQNIYAIPRASVGDARINIGQITAGSGRNVVCDRVKMVMELRGLTQASLEYLRPYAERIIEHGAAMHGCTAEIKIMGATPCVYLDEPSFVEEMKEVCIKTGLKCSGPTEGNTSEDYSYMAQRVMEHGGKSLMFRCLSDIPAPAHSVQYDLQEKDILSATKFECAAVLHLCGIEF